MGNVEVSALVIRQYMAETVRGAQRRGGHEKCTPRRPADTRTPRNGLTAMTTFATRAEKRTDEDEPDMQPIATPDAHGAVVVLRR